MLSIVTAIFFLAEWSRTPLKSPIPESEPVVYRVLTGKLAKPKVSPLGQWNFDLSGVGALDKLSGDLDRIRVFGQSGASSPIVAVEAATRFLSRLFDFNYNLLKLDHSPEFNNQRIDVYLCEGGVAGGQQRFGEDPNETDSFGRSTKVNTIYIYQIATLTDRVEACRELAHEYGHATLPAVKVTGGREEWANGHLGERIFMRYLHGQLVAGTLSPPDVFNADAAGLGGYLDKKFHPLVSKISQRGPDPSVLKAKSDAAFEAYLSMACYAYETLPIETFRRSILLNPDQSPAGYAKALLEALGERKVQNLRRPGKLPLKEWWVPVGKGKVVDATILESRAGWSKIRASGSVSIKNSVDNSGS